ncbi:hypothetical protein NQZ68_016682 [Dissostichus eleginoides]|nr:hypothetical protein NQZ68_016682 [Dissostichus eleginoides]
MVDDNLTHRMHSGREEQAGAQAWLEGRRHNVGHREMTSYHRAFSLWLRNNHSATRVAEGGSAEDRQPPSRGGRVERQARAQI